MNLAILYGSNTSTLVTVSFCRIRADLCRTGSLNTSVGTSASIRGGWGTSRRRRGILAPRRYELFAVGAGSGWSALLGAGFLGP